MSESAVAAPQWDALSARLLPFIRNRVASAADADDVLQEVLLRMHRGLPSLSNEQHLLAWTYRIARNAITDHLRRRARQPLAVPHVEPSPTAPHAGPTHIGPKMAGSFHAGQLGSSHSPGASEGASLGDSSAPEPSDDDDAARALARMLGHFVEQLPEPYGQAITLTDLQGHTQQQAADMLGISLSAMKSRVARGRAKLRQSLQRCCAIALDARGKVVDFEPRHGGDCQCC